MNLERIVEKLWKFELEKPMSVQMLMNYVRNIEDNVESSEDNRILPCEILKGSFEDRSYKCIDFDRVLYPCRGHECLWLLE